MEDVFAQLHQAARQDDADDTSTVIELAYEHLDDFAAFPLDEILPAILALIEAYPELGYGGPGPFGSYIEAHATADFAPALLASLERQPSVQVIGWLSAATHGNSYQNGHDTPAWLGERFAAQLARVLTHPRASGECRDFAGLCLSGLQQRGVARV